MRTVTLAGILCLCATCSCTRGYTPYTGPEYFPIKERQTERTEASVEDPERTAALKKLDETVEVIRQVGAQDRRGDPEVARLMKMADAVKEAGAKQEVPALRQTISDLRGEADRLQRLVTERGQRLFGERQTFDRDLASVCPSKAPACKKRCDDGDHLACISLTRSAFAAAPSASTAAAALEASQKACSASVETGCIGAAEIAKEWASKREKLDSLWSPVARAVTQIAEIRYGSRMARTLAPSAQNLRAAGRAEGHAAQLVKTDFCPAKTAFIEATGRKIFDAYARSLCEDEPPTSGSPSGDLVALTTECKAVIASPCPAAVVTAAPGASDAACRARCPGPPDVVEQTHCYCVCTGMCPP